MTTVGTERQAGCPVLDRPVTAPSAASAPVRVSLADERLAVRRAREVVARCGGAAGLDEHVLDSAVLLTSEVVTNALLHGHSVTDLTVAAGPAGVHVAVGDRGPARPRRVERGADALDGRGMAIVDALAHDWGVRPGDDGKVVWFEVAADAAYDLRHG
jgi:anti-sigma regulatory factor (Ser/Thr protein kinase)